MMISGSRPSPHNTGPTSFPLPPRRNQPFLSKPSGPYCKTGSATSRPKISTMQKPPDCRLQQKTSQPGDPEDGPISPPSSIVVGCPRRFARGRWVQTVPMGPQGQKRKVLTLWLVRNSGRKKCAYTVTHEWSFLRRYPTAWPQMRGRPLSA